MNYQALENIQMGYLPLRRWSKRLPLLLISANLWLDYLITYLLESSKTVMTQSSGFMDTIPGYKLEAFGYSFEAGKFVYDYFELGAYHTYLQKTIDGIDLLMYVLLAISIFFWFRIAASLIFVYADFRITYWDRGKVQYFIVLAILFNVLVYYLIQYWVTYVQHYQ